MILLPKLGAVALLLLLSAVPGTAHPGAVYLPHSGDGFSYRETVVVDGQGGNYTGYSEETWINGTESVTAVGAGTVDSAHYTTADHWADNQGDSSSWTSAGDYTFNATNRTYVNGTDNQTGYTPPVRVWFYIDNTAGTGATFYVLNTQFRVDGTNVSCPLALSPTGYVATIEATGSGAFERDDSYGIFNATFDWTEYFDPGTGYIVAYQYNEEDTNGAGDRFSWTDTLAVTSTTYALTSASPPATSSPGLTLSPLVLLAIALGVIVVVVIAVIALARRARRAPSLPRHSGTGRVDYQPGPGMAPPPVRLTPGGQPAVQQIVLKETVKVNCRYCGTLIDTTATVCPNCGAART